MCEMGSGARVVRAKRLDPPMARNATHYLARATYRVFDVNFNPTEPLAHLTDIRHRLILSIARHNVEVARFVCTAICK